jgi:hypothetical protein
METTENDVQPTLTPTPGLALTPEAQYYLKEIGKWANFLGIVGFILCALFLVLALCIGAVFSMLAKFSPGYSALPSGIFPVFSVIFILIDVLYFFFPYYLYQFAGRIKKGLALMDADQVAQAIGKLKSFFKLWGIVTIVMLCFYALEIFVFIIIGTALHR